MATKTPSQARSLTRAGLDVAQPDAGDLGRLPAAQDLLDDAVPDDRDLRVAEQPVLQNLLGAQLVAAMDQGDAAGVVGEVERLLDRGVAAADHHDFLVAEEEPVAGRAGRDAKAAIGLLARQAEPARLRAGREIIASRRL